MKSAAVFAILATIAVMVTPGSHGASPIIADTVYGQVSGTMDQGGYAFKGIPYAAPPVGNLRFAPPEEPTPWPGIRDGSKFGPGCMARCSPLAFPKPDIMCTPTTSEDCLFLNVFTPTLNTSANLPVIMFMHGGNYIGGSGGVPLYDGGSLAMTQNVVVVTINYRLGLIGGLYTGTTRGNFQTLDQRESMKWIQKSISAFGGDPMKVTITGQSAGAFSVAVHLTAPGSWPYFQRAIIVSDPFSLPAGDPEMSIKLGTKVLEKLGCPVGGDPELACLRAANASHLQYLAEHVDYTPWPNQMLGMMMQWVPVVDGNVLPFQPLDALSKEGAFNKVPVLFGTVANESVQFIYDLSPKPMGKLDYDILLDSIFGLNNANLVRKEYGDLPPSDYKDARNWLSVIATDYIFYCPNRAVGRGLAKGTDTFMYYFDQLGTWNNWVFEKVMPWCVNHVCHASDLPFIFNPFNAPEMKNISKPASAMPTTGEDHLIDFMQTVWGNFAKHGDPNHGRTFPHAPAGLKFPNPFNATTNILVNYSIPVGMTDGYRNKQCDFWDKIGYYRW